MIFDAVIKVITGVIYSMFAWLPIPGTPEVLTEFWEHYLLPYFVDAIEFLSCFFIFDDFKLLMSTFITVWSVKKTWMFSSWVYHHLFGSED